MYVYGFVHPKTGRVEFFLMPGVNSEQFSLTLEHLAEQLGVGPDKRVVLVLDQAGWHTSAKVRVPEGLHLIFQPSNSPELQPSERLWPLINETLANKLITTLDQLEELLFKRCKALTERPELIRRHTHFHWWPSMQVC